MEKPTIVPSTEDAITSPNASTTPGEVTYYEVRSLALELCEAEGYTLGEAMAVAANDLDYYLDYVAPQWDRMALYAGNDDALPF